MRLAIAVVLAFTVMAGGLALLVAVLVLAFNLVWETQPPGPSAREPGDDTAPGAGQGTGQAPRPASRDGERR